MNKDLDKRMRDALSDEWTQRCAGCKRVTFLPPDIEFHQNPDRWLCRECSDKIK